MLKLHHNSGLQTYIRYVDIKLACICFNYTNFSFIQGEKVFYFVEPSEENFTKYEKQVSSAQQSEVFFGDMVKNCYKCSVKPGQTMFIPTGVYEMKQPVNP